jgi:SAM-dependent methyltransferase
MSSVPASEHEFDHDVAAATRLFRQWHVYRSIVDRDWMHHRGIQAAIRRWALERLATPFSLLDLGCGDAGLIRETFAGTPLADYTGVDASSTAVAQARECLAGAGFSVRLVETDLLLFLADHAARTPPTGIVLAGYVVHHLPVAEKQRFFEHCRRALADDGALLLYDIFCRGSETRDSFIADYVAMIDAEWGLSPEAFASTREHVTARDFPETVDTVLDMARTSGFRPAAVELFRDHRGFHRLFCFQPASGVTSREHSP